MKKLYPLIIGLFLFTGINAQVNYSFSALSGTYTNLVGGTSPAFTVVSGGYTSTDEGFAVSIPIGFSFSYNGSPYTLVSINTNGFISLGAAQGDFDGYYTNNLSTGPSVHTAVRPLIAPLWDDYDFSSTSNITYLTSGSAPNRVFTVQWRNALWNYNASTPSISFQAKLYETTNVIEFVYNQESGTPNSPGASIGITAIATGAGNFMSVQDAAGSAVSTTVSANSIATRPATGQIFRFTPLVSCSGTPTGGAAQTSSSSVCSIDVFTLSVTGSTSSLGLTYQWQSSPNNSTWSDIGGATSATLNTSESATTYYRRKILCGASFDFSASVVVNYIAGVGLPFSQTFDAVTPPAMPSCVKVEDVNADAITWITGAGNGTTIPTTNLRYSWNSASAANDWIYFGPFTFNAGATYTLAFKYKASNGPTYVEKLEVKYGTTATAAGMTSAAIFSNTNIASALADPYAIANAPFTVPSSGSYFVGFRVFSIADQAVLHVDDITISNGVFPVTLKSFTGERKETGNLLSWTTSTEVNSKGFELQRSSDGRNFSSIASVASKAENGNSNAELNYNYLDVKPVAGTNYYRLKQLDKDGRFSYSDVVVLKSKISEITLSSYPNPVKDVLSVKITSPSNEKLTIVVTDMTGKIVMKRSANAMMGDNAEQLNVSQLAPGSYMIKAICANGCETAVQRFVKQ